MSEHGCSHEPPHSKSTVSLTRCRGVFASRPWQSAAMSTEATHQDLWSATAFERLLEGARHARSSEEAWLHLEAAHVVGQMRLKPHLTVHGRMLVLACRQRNVSEVMGQAIRLGLVPLGHLFRRLPWGNTGRSHVSAFQPMAVRVELRALIDRMGAP